MHLPGSIYSAMECQIQEIALPNVPPEIQTLAGALERLPDAELFFVTYSTCELLTELGEFSRSFKL